MGDGVWDSYLIPWYEMKELVTQAQAEMVLRIVAVAAPIGGTVVGAVVGAARRRMLRTTISGLAVGLSGTAVYGMWRLYNALGSRLGYTSVLNLAVQVAVFAGVGIGVGLVIRKAVGMPRDANEDGQKSVRSSREERVNAS